MLGVSYHAGAGANCIGAGAEAIGCMTAGELGAAIVSVGAGELELAGGDGLRRLLTRLESVLVNVPPAAPPVCPPVVASAPAGELAAGAARRLSSQSPAPAIIAQ